MQHVFSRLTIASLALLGTALAQAANVTTLNFNGLLSFAQHIELDHTVGGELDITPVGGKYLVDVLGMLGVTNKVIGDYSINKNEGVLFTFDKKVSLIGWDMEDLPRGTNTFSLKVDSGAAQTLSLQSVQPNAPLVGKSFQFGWLGESYLIDSLKFASWAEPVKPPSKGSALVTAIPEPSSAALMLACGATLVFVSRRKMKP